MRHSKKWPSGSSKRGRRANPRATLEFESPAALFRMLTPERWELIERLQERESSSVRGLASELGRDVERIQEDLDVLIECGLVARTTEGKFNVPYDVIRAEFDLRAVV